MKHAAPDVVELDEDGEEVVYVRYKTVAETIARWWRTPPSRFRRLVWPLLILACVCVCEGAANPANHPLPTVVWTIVRN